MQTWVLHHIQIIGEAARNVSEDLRINHPTVPWSEIVAMRNVLVHDYFGVDVEEVWATVERDLPVLRRKIEEILQNPQDGQTPQG